MSQSDNRFLCRLWLKGVITGTLLIGVTSPLFVRSYLPRVVDQNRGVLTFPQGSTYRHTSEGYGRSQIQRYGSIGRASSPPDSSPKLTLALWGDSQAEGVSVFDDEKIAAFAARHSHGALKIWNFARSGDDCNDWLAQIENLDGIEPSIDQHFFLIVEWSDWCVPVTTRKETVNPNYNLAASYIPAFLIQAGRNLLLTEDNQIRSLRFTPGPIASTMQTDSQKGSDGESPLSGLSAAKRQLLRLSEITDKRCVFVYAPKTPRIASGKLVTKDGDTDLFDSVATFARTLGFEIIDLRKEMAESVSQGKWPRGFQNGQFGVGHYNAHGNEIIANAINAATATKTAKE